ncbi:MAG: L-2-amino-thiazoline-4-carboxylic acid hydrolase [Clostridium sp.]
MKMLLMGNTYPLILDGVIKEQLQLYFDKDSVKTIIKKVNEEYKAVIKRAPDIGGKENIFIDIMYLGSYVIALYKNMKDKVTIEQFNVMIKNGIENCDLLKKKMKKIDISSVEYNEKLEIAEKWSESNKEKYPTNWILKLPKDVKSDGIYFEFNRCALCALCKSEGVLELIPSLCEIEYIVLNMANCTLTRRKTLGGGDACCNFWIR